MATKVRVYYHYPCRDGWVAALAAWRFFSQQGTGPVVYEGWTHQRDAAARSAQLTDAWSCGHGSATKDSSLDGSKVYFLDLCPPPELLLNLLERGCQIVVLDHHQSTVRRLDELTELSRTTGRLLSLVNPRMSGCAIAWSNFFPQQPMPDLWRYVQDRDLWAWKITASREVNAALGAYAIPAVGTPEAFDRWMRIAARLATPAGLMSHADVGRVLLEQQQAETVKVLERARLGLVCGHQVPVVNLTSWHSEALMELLRRNETVPFVAGYFDGASSRHWSLRTAPGRGCDVSLLAEQKGGGGHTMAAGFEEALPPSSYGPVLLDSPVSEPA